MTREDFYRGEYLPAKNERLREELAAGVTLAVALIAIALYVAALYFVFGEIWQRFPWELIV